MRRLILLLSLGSLIGGGLGRADNDPRAPYCVNYDATVKGAELALYRTVILSPRTTITDIEALRAARTRIHGYISIGEIAEEDAAKPALATVPVIGENKAWRSRIPDVTHPAWSDWVVNTCAAAIDDRGWHGFFLDTADSARLPEGLPEATYLAREKAIAAILARLKTRYPELKIIINRGFASIKLDPTVVDGVLAEGLLSSFDDQGKYHRVAPEETAQLRAELDRWKTSGKTVYALDYCDPANREEAAALYAGITACGYEALVAKPDLMNDAALAPLRRLPRTGLVIFGAPIGEGLVEHPTNCLTRTSLVHPVTWHGYSLEYVNAHVRGIPANLNDYDLVIFEPFKPSARTDMKALAKTVAARIRSRKKTIFLNSLSTWTEYPDVWETLSEATGWSGSGNYVAQSRPPKLILGDPALMRAEGHAAPRAHDGLPDLQTPKNGKALIRQTVGDHAGATSLDSAFTAPFGGVLLAPWVNEIDAIDRVKARVDFFTFADRVFGPPEPTFDTTTRTGCRLWFNHIDGDGLHAMSKVRLGQLSGEIMRDEIYKKYPVPFTSSVITAEILGHAAPRPTPQDIIRRREVARSIFALPNVEVASHTYSHPFAWTQDNITSATYAQARLTLLPEYHRPLNYRNETIGSVETINKEFCPPGKTCQLLLWSGNCLPPTEAIAHLDAIGLPNLNGLATDATHDSPYLANIRGCPITVDGVTQVGAPFENDNVYYDMEKDGLEGGFARVTEAFEITGAPRRLLPVNAYWHFFSADTVERLRALKHVLDWSTARPLHPIFASEYARMMRDLRRASRYEDTRGGHLFAMSPGCLTLRYHGTVHPDMRRSSGILGYRHELGVTYVHTDGARTVRVVLRKDDDKAPRLEYSTRPVSITRGERAWSVAFDGFSPGKARFTGFAPKAVVRTPGGTYAIDESGTLELDARPGERLEIPLP